MKKKMIKTVMVLSVVSLFSSVIVFLFLPVLASTLSLSAFADYSFYYAATGVFASVCLFGAPASFSIAAAEKNKLNEIEVVRFLVSSNVIVVATSSVIILILILFFKQPWGLIFIPLLVASRSFFIQISHYFRVYQRVKSFSAYQLLTLTTVFVFPLIVASYVDLKGLEFISLMTLVMVISVLVGSQSLKKDGLLKFRLRNPYRSFCAKFGFYSAAHSFMAALITVADRFILKAYIDKEQFAVYSLAATLASALGLVFATVNQNMTPEFYKEMKETSKHWQVLFKYFSFYMAFVFIVSGFYQLLIADVVSFFFPESYQDAIPYARWLAVGAMIQGSYFFASALLMFLQRSDRLFFITGTVGSVGLVSGILMYQWLGVFGVVYSYIFVWLLFSAATYFTGYKCVKEYISNA